MRSVLGSFLMELNSWAFSFFSFPFSLSFPVLPSRVCDLEEVANLYDNL